jgi:hypothetical protein
VFIIYQSWRRINIPVKYYDAQLQVMIIIIDHFNLHALEMFLYTKIIPVHMLCSYWWPIHIHFFVLDKKININMQTHHSIKTAYKLVPGIFYRIILLKKMLCCNNYHYLELCVIIHAWLLLVEVFFRGVHLKCEKNPIHIIHFIGYNINIQTHHSINTAYKLVPGIFYWIILLKKMLCCAMEMKLGC